jgi:hypothetical protein
LNKSPPDVSLVAGIACSVSVVEEKGLPVARRDRELFYRLETCFREIQWAQPRDIDLGITLAAPLCDVFSRIGDSDRRSICGRSPFANHPLAKAALYFCILASLIAFWMGGTAECSEVLRT